MSETMKNVHVLIVEDDPDQVMLYSTKFSLEGISVVAVGSQQDVVRHLRDGRFDLVLMDILLRGENGLEILAHIKQDDSFRQIPVAMFTNFNNREAREQAQEYGAIDFIVKSDITPKQAAVKVRDIVARMRG